MIKKFGRAGAFFCAPALPDLFIVPRGMLKAFTAYRRWFVPSAWKIKIFNSIGFSKSMHYSPLAYIHSEADILKFVNTLIANTKGEGKEGDPFWTKSETLLYCALIAYIIFEGPAEARNMNTLVDMISGMEVNEDDDDFMNGATRIAV